MRATNKTRLTKKKVSELYILAAAILEENWNEHENNRAGNAIAEAFEIDLPFHFWRITDFIHWFADRKDSSWKSGIKNLNAMTVKEKVLALLFMAQFVRDRNA